jgi:hypothetical protein
MISHRVPVVLVVSTCLTADVATAANDQALLQLTLEAHRATAQSFQSFYCKYSTKINVLAVGYSGEEKGEYWRTLDGARIRSMDEQGPAGRQAATIWISGSRRTTLTEATNSSGKRSANVSVSPQGELAADTIWAKALFAFTGPQAEIHTLDGLLRQPHRLRSIAHVMNEGRDLIHLDLSHAKARLEFWFDPTVNFLVRKYVIHGEKESSGKTQEWHTTVTSFREVGSGQFFPERIESRVLHDGETVVQATTAFTEMRLDARITPADLKPKYPAGVEILDSVEGKVFITDAKGVPKVAPGKHLAIVGPMPASASREVMTQTLEEPGSIIAWIAPISVGILLLAGIGYLLRRYRGWRLGSPS